MTNIDVENEIQEIINSFTVDNDIPNEFRSREFSYKELNTGEERDDYSTNVQWDLSFQISKKGFTFKVYVSGTASANIPYDRWTDTDCYSVDYDSIAEIT